MFFSGKHVFFFLCFLSFSIQAQDYFNIGARFHQGAVIPHRTDIDYLKGSHPKGLEFDFSCLDAKKSIWKNYGLVYRHGFSLSYFNYDNQEILGNVIQFYRYIEPIYNLNKNIFFSYRLGVGVAYLNNPYDKIINPENLTYSIGLNSYFTGNLNIYYKIKSNFHSSISLCMNHNSNGGIDKPNLGINYPSIALGAYYIIDNDKTLEDHILHLYNNKEEKKLDHKYDKNQFTVSSFFSLRNLDNRLQGAESTIYDPVLGLYLNYSRRFHNIHTYNIGLDFISDYSFKRHIELLPIDHQYYQGEDVVFNTLSIMIGHSFLFGKYSLSQNIGCFLLNKSPFDGKIYQYYNLSYNLSDKLVVGSGVRVYWAIAYFPDISIGIKF